MYSSNVSNKSCFMDKMNIFITCDVIFSSKFKKYMILRDISLFFHIKCYKSAHNGRNYYYRVLYIWGRIYHGCLCMLEAANISPSMRTPPRPMPLQGWRSVRYTQQTYGIHSFFIFLYESPHNKLFFWYIAYFCHKRLTWTFWGLEMSYFAIFCMQQEIKILRVSHWNFWQLNFWCQ